MDINGKSKVDCVYEQEGRMNALGSLLFLH